MSGRVWDVVGGSKSGGLLVRTGQKLSSPEDPERLAVGSNILEVALVGERLQFRLLSGSGPAQGWISMKAKGIDLLSPHIEPTGGGPADWGDDLMAPADAELARSLSRADALGEPYPDGTDSPHMNDPPEKKARKAEFIARFDARMEELKQELGTWRQLLPAKAPALGPLHILCVCCAETGHLTPLLRIARACCNRENVGRVSFVTNAFGGSKMESWLTSSPDPTGKLALYTFQDGWTEEFQNECNWWAQNEDGSLLGLSNVGLGLYSIPLLLAIATGPLKVSVLCQDMASGGYTFMWDSILCGHPKWGEFFKPIPVVMSAPATILGAFVFAGGPTTLLHCFNDPSLAPLLAIAAQVLSQGEGDMASLDMASIMMQAMSGQQAIIPENVKPVGIIADEATGNPLPQHLQDFLDKEGPPVVYVSMGSVASFDEGQLAKVCEGLKAPGEWRIIWSLKRQQQDLLPRGGTKALGEDFLVSDWLPQVELLGHKKVVAFLSHCGWGATCEAMVTGTPVIAFPMFADQNINAILMETLAMCKLVGLQALNSMMQDPTKMKDLPAEFTKRQTYSVELRQTFTAEGLRNAIREVVKDRAYTGRAKAVKIMNRRFGGGAGKAAEEIESEIARGPRQAKNIQWGGVPAIAKLSTIREASTTSST